MIEIFRAVFYKKFKVEEYRVPFFIFVFNGSRQGLFQLQP